MVEPLRVAWLAALVGLLLAPGDARAYTLKHAADGQLVRWHATEIVLCVFAGSGSARGPSRDDVYRAAVMAADTWSEVPGVPDIRIADGPCELGVLDGVNAIGVVDEWTNGPRLGITQSHYRTGGQLVEADVLINGTLPLAMVPEHDRFDSFDLASLLTHEMGHVLGLDESLVPGAVMWPTTRPGEIHQRELAPDDVDAVLTLYGGAEAGEARFATYGCAAAPRPRSVPWAWPLALIALLLARRRSA